MRVRMAMLSLITLLACSVDPHSAIQPIGPVALPAVVGQCNTTGNAGSSDSHWQAAGVNMFPCQSTITVDVTSSSSPVSVTSTALASAMATWNNGVLQNYGLPQFASGGANPYHVHINEVGSGQYICGTTTIGTQGTITITHSASPASCADVPSAVSYVTPGVAQVVPLVAHELGHALGFKKHLLNDTQAHVDQDTIVRDCIDVVPTNLNTAVCEHERQIVYYQYGIQNSDPSTAKVFVYSISESPPTLSLDLNQTGSTTASLYIVDHNHLGGVLAPPGAGDVITWSLTNLSPAGSFSITNSDATSASVKALLVPGTGALQAVLTSSATYNIAWPFNAREYNGAVPLSNPGPTAPPSNLAVSNVTASSAQLSWTSGDANATTTVQDRQTAVGGAWTTAGTLAVGTTTFGLTGLSACTTYDVNLYHVRNGINSAAYTVGSAFGTAATSGACVPTNFHIVQCHAEGNFEYYNLGWTRTEFSSGSTYEIGQGTTNNSANATVISSGSSATTATTIGPYDRRKLTSYYFWVRQKLANGTPSAWAALYDNPVSPNQGC